ncbi:MAG: hypothetical protein KIT09_10145 [Bryobacteraceae bacterium]|nr:hypothetical protein [Bryobacteraceae bacterium]
MGGTKALALLIAAGLAISCASERRLVVGSKNFTEQLVLGEILAQQVERRLSTRVERRLNLGGTMLAHQALVSGGIDLYPEYTGTALTAVLRMPPERDAARVFESVSRAYEEKFSVKWLPPLGFNNSFAMVVRGADARAGGLATLSDAARRGGWTLGIGYEFERRPDGLAALNAYNLTWNGQPKTMDLGLLYRALQQGQVTMVAANGTDGMLSKLDVSVLEDDKGVFPPYEAAVVVRAEALDEFEGLQEALTALSGAISQATMRRLNYQVDGEHRPLDEVAREFLRGFSE